MEKMSQLGFSHALGGWELGAIQVFFFQGEGEGEGEEMAPAARLRGSGRGRGRICFPPGHKPP